MVVVFFFFNDAAASEIYTLSLHDALPIYAVVTVIFVDGRYAVARCDVLFIRTRHSGAGEGLDRKSTRLNSSHGYISYAVFCLKKKKLSEVLTISGQITLDLRPHTQQG